MNPDEPHPFYKNFTRRQVSEMRRGRKGKYSRLVKIEEKNGSWWAVYSNGKKYSHPTEADCRSSHRFT